MQHVAPALFFCSLRVGEAQSLYSCCFCAFSYYRAAAAGAAAAQAQAQLEEHAGRLAELKSLEDALLPLWLSRRCAVEAQWQ